MNRALVIALLGLVLISSGVFTGSWGVLAVWLGGDFVALAIAHTMRTHRLFGKRANGTIPIWRSVVFLPLLAYTWTVWHLLRMISREPACTAVTDHLVVGRRLLSAEICETFDNYVDLTAEFIEPSAIRSSPGYCSFPILDGSAPTVEALHGFINSLRPGRTFVHCAQGHGRTGLFALALLLSSGAARTAEDGLQLLQAARPGIRLNRIQRKCIWDYARRYAKTSLPDQGA